MSEVDLCASSEVPDGGKKAFSYGGKPIVVSRVGGVAYALEDVCPHRGAQLSDGDLQGHHLYCPLHAWCFDVRTGLAFFPQGAKVHRYLVREEGGRLYLRAAN